MAAGQLVVVLEPAQQEARLVGGQLAIDQRRQLLPVVQFEFVGGIARRRIDAAGNIHARLLSRVALAVSSRGRNCASMASRARNIRERTVPIGHPIFCAISS